MPLVLMIIYFQMQFQWANYIEDILPKEYLHIHIEKNLDNGENFRTITLTPYGERYNYIKELKV